MLGVDGVSDFDGLHSRQHDDEVQLYAFDILTLDGEDIRRLPLSMRKTNLARLLARRPDGIFTAPFEQGEIGPDLFRKACEFGLEGIVSKHRERAYRPGTSPNWVKVKNPKYPAFSRVAGSIRLSARYPASRRRHSRRANVGFHGRGGIVTPDRVTGADGKGPSNLGCTIANQRSAVNCAVWRPPFIALS